MEPGYYWAKEASPSAAREWEVVLVEPPGIRTQSVRRIYDDQSFYDITDFVFADGPIPPPQAGQSQSQS